MARSRVRTRREKRADPEPDSGDAADVSKKIVRRGTQYCVTSEDGSRNFGCFATRAEAERRLGQVESFKDEKADWTAAFINSLPDSAFLHVLPGGKKDSEGKTVPRTLRMFPIRNASGAVDLPHLRNALSRIPQSTRISQGIKDRLAAEARRILDRETRKQAEGHFHVFGGAESSRDFGPSHVHRVEVSPGAVVVSTPSDPGPEHTHEIAIGSVTIESGPPLVDETGLAKGLLPRVLSWSAVALGEMPELGSSGLEKSLEADVPARFRYWTAKAEDEARSVRDALVEAQVFTPENVRKVDGESRRTIVETSIFLAKQDVAPELLEQSADVELAGARLVVANADVTIVAADVVDALDPTRVGDLLKKSEPWVAVVAADSDRLPAIRAESRKVFRLRTRPGVAFATSQDELVSSALVVEELPLDDDVSKALRRDVTILITKADHDAEEQFVLGIVLEPDVVDSQKDTYDVATVRATAHKYMSEFQNVGLMHRKLINGKATVVQSFVAPVAMEIAGTTIKIGTWLVGMLFDDDIWADVKSGKLTSFSIGGDAVRKPVAAEST